MALIGVFGVFVSQFMENVQNDSSRIQLRYEVMSMKNSFIEGFSRNGACKMAMESIVDKHGLGSDPAKSFPAPLELESLLIQVREKPGFPDVKEKASELIKGHSYGGHTIQKIELIGSIEAPNSALKLLTKNVGSLALDYYQGLFKITLTKGRAKVVTLMPPVNISFDKNNKVSQCWLNSSFASDTAETCANLLREKSGFSSFGYHSGNCFIKIDDQEFQVKNAKEESNILCQIEKKIQAMKPGDTTVAPKQCAVP